MGPELWKRLASVFAAGGGAVLVTLLIGTAVVPLARRYGFVSRESKVGVAQGKRDSVPMGGGFILLLGVTVVVLALTLLGYVRQGYAYCFLIAFWGFGFLGFLDDHSKTRKSGYNDRIKVLLQVTVTLAFAIVFYLYYRRFVNSSDLEFLTVPFIGPVSLGLFIVPFLMLFLFWVSNGVNITDGFNGLAGGTGAVVALAYAVVTFLIGASELSVRGETEIGIRMFAVSRMSAVIAGSLASYLYFNYCKGSIFFGDTGSMALGAALAFLAVFSRTEFLFFVIGGVFFTEATSVFLQRMSVALTQQVLDPMAQQVNEPFRPFIIAPLHHHFEHLMTRELEGDGHDPAELRVIVRRRITRAAWLWALLFGALGVTAEYGHYLQRLELYDWSILAGVLVAAVILAHGVLTRFLYDCYFIGPSRDGGQRLVLYRGIPWRLVRRPLYHVYEDTDIPLTRLGYLERRTGLFHLFFSRVDARVTFGLLHYQIAERSRGAERAEHLRRALTFWEKVPQDRFLTAQRHDMLDHMATAYAEGHRYAAAVNALETLYRNYESPLTLVRIEQLQADALSEAETAYTAWTANHACDSARAQALAAHQELLNLIRIRYERAKRVRDQLEAQEDAAPEERIALDNQLQLLQEAKAIAADRCDRLQPVAEEVAAV